MPLVSHSTPVHKRPDLCRLADKASLATLRPSARAAAAFRFLGIEILEGERCQMHNLCTNSYFGNYIQGS
jgi:hypothetical protein